MTAPFIVFGLPRSRTFWLSKFLSYGEWECGHDQARYIRSLADAKSWLAQGMTGTVETSAAPYWRLIREMRPDIRIAVVRRPAEQVVESLLRAGIGPDRTTLTANMERLDRKLDQIERRIPDALSVQFDDLADEKTAARIFTHCLPYKHDPIWWGAVSGVNMQVNLASMLRYMAANAEQLRLTVSLCRQESLRLLSRARKPVSVDGITFQEESFISFYNDAQKLFAQHLSDVGEPSDQFRRKNLPLFTRLDEIGSLHIMTARSNGRMFGYLMTVLSPSLEDDVTQMGTQATFYASPDVPGLGMRLQRASVNALKARGGRWDVIQRAGIRGDGPRIGTMYKRMGAEEFGQLYKLPLGG